MMFFDDNPGVLYENPPPPRNYEFDFEADPVFFTYPRPQRIVGVTFFKIDRNLIHKDLIRFDEEEENSSNTILENGSSNNLTNNENTTSITTEKVNTEAPVNKIAPEKQGDKNKVSKEKVLENANLKKVEIESVPIIENDSAIDPVVKQDSKQKDQADEEKEIHADSGKGISKKKNVPCTKTSALESISKSFSGKSLSKDSDLDSENETVKKSISSSHRAKSHSNKSKHKRKDKSPRKHSSHSDIVSNDKVGVRSTNLTVKKEIFSDEDNSLNSSISKRNEILIKEEVLSDKDDNNRDKIRRSKSSKKNHSDSRNRIDDRHYKDRKYYDSRRRRSSSDDSRKMYSDDNRSKYSEDSQERYYMKKEIKEESEYYIPNDLYCDVCKLLLNSEMTYDSHMAGKKHKKALRLKNEENVAKSQLLDLERSQSGSRYSFPQERDSEDIKKSLGYPKASDMERSRLRDMESTIQSMCEDTKLIILGLDYIQEIQGYEEKKYFCKLCNAQCVSNSIINHLIGFRHQLSCVKIYCPATYDWIKNLDRRDKGVDFEIKEELRRAMKRFGRGKIQVYKDRKKYHNFPDPSQPSTSREYPDELIKKSEELTGLTVTEGDSLSRDFSDFYCKVCKSHMNNHSMWESHVRGKKHARNKKKVLDGLVSDSNYIEAPRGTISKLEVMIENCTEDILIVGLSFIKETQGENGNLYNCFLCGSVSPTCDIMNHLKLMKHKIKYLEKMLSNGYINAIDQISTLPIGDHSREDIINDECRRMLAQAGRGKPVIAIAKKTFA